MCLSLSRMNVANSLMTTYKNIEMPPQSHEKWMNFESTCSYVDLVSGMLISRGFFLLI